MSSELHAGRDHRDLGRDLDLFSTSPDVGPGLILWHPHGAMLRHLAERFSHEAHLLNGYEPVVTPHVGKGALWETSGHLDYFADSMFRPMEVESERYYLKPMNCPFHIQIFKSRPRSYRELPVRFAEFGTVYRYELSGVLQGLTRARGFTVDDSHIFCREEQAPEEVLHALRFSLYVLRAFGLEDFSAYVATRPEGKAVGEPAAWERATAVLRDAVEREGLAWEYDEGGGAFYGPKIDLKVRDSLGREWQLSTVQFDFNLPERFGLEYVGSDGERHRPVMVHRALFGSVERFLALLIEHHGGAFPLWLAPVQAAVLPVADRHLPYAREVAGALRAAGMRVEVDDRDDRLPAKVRDVELRKLPFALVVGDREAEAGSVAVRARGEGKVVTMSVDELLSSTHEARQHGVARVI
jgi:threonyl-tRNA synthetase